MQLKKVYDFVLHILSSVILDRKQTKQSFGENYC